MINRRKLLYSVELRGLPIHYQGYKDVIDSIMSLQDIDHISYFSIVTIFDFIRENGLESAFEFNIDDIITNLADLYGYIDGDIDYYPINDDIKLTEETTNFLLWLGGEYERYVCLECSVHYTKANLGIEQFTVLPDLTNIICPECNGRNVVPESDLLGS